MKLFKREDYLEKIRGFYYCGGIIKITTDVRHCGKSCLMETIIPELMLEGKGF